MEPGNVNAAWPSGVDDILGVVDTAGACSHFGLLAHGASLCRKIVASSRSRQKALLLPASSMAVDQ